MKDGIPYARYAFHNLYNYSLLGGVGAAALLTQNWWLGVVGLGLEALWMVFAPDSKIVQKKMLDPMHEAKCDAAELEEKKKKLATLPMSDAQRYEKLAARGRGLRTLAAKNRAFASDLLEEEFAKLGTLLESFLELLLSCDRYEQYLSTVDAVELDQEIDRAGRDLEHMHATDERRPIVEKNRAVLETRLERLLEIKRYVAKARAQMDLIENTFELLGDQIVTMSSPTELGGQLDELIDGVEAVRSTAREAASFVQSVAG